MTEKICPLRMMGTSGNMSVNDMVAYFGCVGDKCQWWQTHYTDTDREYSECVVESLSSIKDLVDK